VDVKLQFVFLVV